MTQYIVQALINGLSVTVGLFLLWSVISRLPRKAKTIGSITAGLVSALITLVISSMAAGATA